MLMTKPGRLLSPPTEPPHRDHHAIGVDEYNLFPSPYIHLQVGVGVDWIIPLALYEELSRTSFEVYSSCWIERHVCEVRSAQSPWITLTYDAIFRDYIAPPTQLISFLVRL